MSMEHQEKTDQDVADVVVDAGAKVAHAEEVNDARLIANLLIHDRRSR